VDKEHAVFHGGNGLHGFQQSTIGDLPEKKYERICHNDANANAVKNK